MRLLSWTRLQTWRVYERCTVWKHLLHHGVCESAVGKIKMIEGTRLNWLLFEGHLYNLKGKKRMILYGAGCQRTQELMQKHAVSFQPSTNPTRKSPYQHFIYLKNAAKPGDMFSKSTCMLYISAPSNANLHAVITLHRTGSKCIYAVKSSPQISFLLWFELRSLRYSHHLFWKNISSCSAWC